MIDLERVQQLNVKDGDLLVVPESTEQADMELLCEALAYVTPGCRVVVVRGPVQLMDVSDMNKLGWYRA